MFSFRLVLSIVSGYLFRSFQAALVLLVFANMLPDEHLCTVLLVLVVMFLFNLVYFNRKNTFSFWKDRGVPYLKPDWLFGNIRNELFTRSTWSDFCIKCYNTFKDKGFGGVYIFSKPVLIVCDPTLVEKILVKNFTSFHDRIDSNYDEPMMKTLFNAHGQCWQIMRSKLIPSFTSAKVKGMFDQITKCCELAIGQIEDKIAFSEPVDVGSLMFMYTTEVIASCAFGIQLLSNNDQRNQFKRSINNLFSLNIFRSLRFVGVLVFPKLFAFFGVSIIYRSVSDFFINLTKETIRYRKRNNIKRNDFLNLLMELKDEEEGVFEIEEDYSKYHEDKLLNSFMKQVPVDPQFHQKEPIFTDDRIAALVFNFITGGLKPAVGTVSLALLEIAKNPLIQKRVVDEIDLALKKHKVLSYEVVRDMEYLDKVIQETLRMYSFSTVLVRLVTEPCTLPGTTLKLEKDQLIYIPVHPLHLDPQYHPSPQVFNPDRFSDSSYKPTSSFIPFGNGPRICIAMKFATMVVKACLARVLLDYSVEVSSKTRLPLVFVKDELFPKPVGGIWLSFCKRK